MKTAWIDKKKSVIFKTRAHARTNGHKNDDKVQLYPESSEGVKADMWCIFGWIFDPIEHEPSVGNVYNTREEARVYRWEGDKVYKVVML